MKRVLSDSTAAIQQNEKFEGNAEVMKETVGLHFTYKNPLRTRSSVARKGRSLGGYQTRHRAQVVNDDHLENKESNEQTKENDVDRPQKQHHQKPVRVPKQSRQTTLSFQSKKDFPVLGNSRPVEVSPGGSWAKSRSEAITQSSPVTSSPIAKVAKPSESPLPLRKQMIPESPLTLNGSNAKLNNASFSRSSSKAQTKLFAKSPATEKSSSPSDYELNFHRFSSNSWADIMDEVDSLKSGDKSLISIDTGSSSLNTTFESVESGDLDGMIQRRSKQIAYGKNTKEYQSYLKAVPYEKRRRGDPITPNKEETYSRRCWDSKVKAWKRQIKEWNTKRLNESIGANSSAQNSLSKILESLPVASKLDPKSPMKKTIADIGNVTPSKKSLQIGNKGSPAGKSPFKRPFNVVHMDISGSLESSPSKRRVLGAQSGRTMCTRSLVAAMNEDSLLNDDDALTGQRRVIANRVDDSSCSTLVDESSCMSTDGGWTVTRMPMPMPMPKESTSQLKLFIQSCRPKDVEMDD